MKLVYKNNTDKVHEMMGKINSKEATIFTRVIDYKECIAIVRSGRVGFDPDYHWVWLSSKEFGGFTDGKGKSLAETAETLVRGEWIHQPNAKMLVE